MSSYTARELEVLRLLARGFGNKQLAAALGMGVRTAESHRADIMRPLSVNSLSELVKRAVREGVI